MGKNEKLFWRSAEDVDIEKYLNSRIPTLEECFICLPERRNSSGELVPRELKVLKPMECYVEMLKGSAPKGTYRFKRKTGAQTVVGDYYTVKYDGDMESETQEDVLKGVLHVLRVTEFEKDEIRNLNDIVLSWMARYRLGPEGANVLGDAIKRFSKIRDKEYFYKGLRTCFIQELADVTKHRTLANLALKTELMLEENIEQGDKTLNLITSRTTAINDIDSKKLPNSPVANAYKNYLIRQRNTYLEKRSNDAITAERRAIEMTFFKYVENSVLLTILKAGGKIEDLSKGMTEQEQLDACLEDAQMYKLLEESKCAPNAKERKPKFKGIEMELF